MSLDSRKNGFPVLAYPHCDVSPLSSFLMFRFNEAQATASILLRSSLSIEGHEEAQTFVLQYDADNLKPGKISLGPATIPLPQRRLDEVVREGNPQMQTLSLTLKRVAPLWCSHAEGLRPSPKLGHEDALDRLAVLAKAMTLHILFDFNWLHHDHHPAFRRLVNYPEQLKGFPVWRHYSKQYRRGDWSVFTRDDGNADAIHKNDGLAREFPPAYAESSKRPRNVTPTPSSPPAKRLLLSPSEAHTSPTEKDSIATPSPKPLHSSASPSPTFSPLDALLPDANRTHTTDRNCAGQEPAATAGINLDDSVHTHDLEEIVSSILPSILSTLLPTLLPRLLTHSPSPAPSLTSLPSQRSTPPPPFLAGPPTHPTPTSALPSLSALGISLTTHLSSRIESELHSLYAQTVSHANYLRNSADAEFWEDKEGERLAFERAAEAAFVEFEEKLQGAGAEEMERVDTLLEGKAERVLAMVDEAVKRVENLKDEERELKRDAEVLRKEKRELRRDIKDLRRQKSGLRRDVRELRRLKRELQRDNGEIVSLALEEKELDLGA